MHDLTRHGIEIRSVFDLLGRDENDLTAALGFTLSHSPKLLQAIMRRLWPQSHEVAESPVGIALEVRDEAGRTDFEVTLPGALLIIEAKRHWLLPSTAQLATYAPRVRRYGRGALVTLSQASHALARVQLPHEVAGVPVVHLPWRDVLSEISTARRACRGHERIWLDQLQVYLKGVTKVRSIADSWTYCVAVSEDRPGFGGPHTFREYVTDQRCYFHPYGVAGWPTDLLNFLAFRWGGAVPRIHHVIHADVAPSLRDRWPDIPATDETVRPHAVYDLGNRLPPFEPIPNGAPYRASRLWVLLDQLQTAATLAAALKQTHALAADA